MNKRIISILLCLILAFLATSGCCELSLKDENRNSMPADEQAALVFTPSVMEQLYMISLDMLTEDYDAEAVADIMEYHSIFRMQKEDGMPEEVQLADRKYVGYYDAMGKMQILFNTDDFEERAEHIVIQSNYSVEEGVVVPLGAALHALGLMSNDMQILNWITMAQNGDSYENEFYKIMYTGENGIDILVVFPHEKENSFADTEAQETVKKEPAVLHGVWEFVYAINVDGDKCLPRDCGGEWKFYLINGGAGFFESDEGYSGLKWSAPEDDIIQIELEDYSVSLRISADSNNLSSVLRNTPEGQAELVFKRTGDVEYKKSKVGAWFTSNTIIDDDDTKVAMVRKFNDDGGSYPLLWMHNAGTDETAVLRGKLGYWLSVKDDMLYWSEDSHIVYKWHCSPMKECTFERIDYSEGENAYEIMLGLLALEYGNQLTVYESSEEVAPAKFDINVPVNYDRPEWYAKRAGEFWGEIDLDGTHYVCKYILDPDGTAEYVMADTLIEPQNIFEQGIYRWKPAEGGVMIWKNGNEEEPLYMRSIYNGYILEFLNERILELSALPESYLTMTREAEENKGIQLRDYLGVWTMIEGPENGENCKIQIELDHFGVAKMNTIVYMPDPRENYQETNLGMGWYPDKNGMILVDEDGDEWTSKHFSWKERQLCSEDGYVYERTADYSAWENGAYHYDAIKDYSQSGYIGVWKSEDLDMWEGEEYLYLYLASDGTGRFVEERYGRISEDSSLVWQPEGEGFSFNVPGSDSFYLLDSNKWFHVKAGAFAERGEWHSPGDGYIHFDHLEMYWSDADAGEDPADAIIDYHVNDDGSITLTDYFLNTDELTIPENIDGYTQIRIGEKLFKGKAFRKVTLPDTVVEIGMSAFQECYNLQEVILGEGLQVLGNNAFQDCSKLIGISIPSGVVSIGDGAFANCAALSSLDMGQGVVSVGAHAFDRCFSLGNVMLPDSILEIGDYAFNACREMNTSLPRNLVRLGEDAFSYCHGITSLTVPASLQTIGIGAFSNCAGLSSIEFEDGLAIIGESMFSGCDSLTDIVVPSSVKIIGDSAFTHCEKLSQVQLQEGVEVIGGYAFNSCESLKNLLLPTTLREIGVLALQSCYALTSLVIPESVEVFGANALGMDQFMLVLKVKEGSVAHAYAEENGIAFEIVGGGSMQAVSYASGKDFSWEIREDGTAVILQYKGIEQSVSVPAELDGCVVTEIGDKAFEANTEIKEVVLSEGIVSIGAKAFYKCSALQRVVLPVSLSEIRNFAFNNCPELTLLVPEDSFAEDYAASKKLKWDNYNPEVQSENKAPIPDVDDSEAALRQALNDLKFANTYYRDFDGDGICEMFVKTYSSGPDEYGLEEDYELWFVSPFMVKLVNKYISEYDSISLVGDGVPYMLRYEEMYGGTNLYGVKNGEPVYLG